MWWYSDSKITPNIIGFTLSLINSTHTHTHTQFATLSLSLHVENWAHQHAVNLSPTPTNILQKTLASAAAPSPKQSHLLSHTQQKLHPVNTLNWWRSIENIWKATTQQPWNRVIAKDWIEFFICCCSRQQTHERHVMARNSRRRQPHHQIVDI